VVYRATQEQTRDEERVDGVQVLGEALVRWETRMQAATQELRREVAAHYGNAAYIHPGTAARAIVRREMAR
jgi:hypothetical protein